jgi:hypothetical protein
MTQLITPLSGCMLGNGFGVAPANRCHKSIAVVAHWRLYSILGVLSYFALGPIGQAVSPPPGGGYPGYNTAVGQNALFSLTTGVWNTALGGYTLYSDTTGAGNTAVGLNALRRDVSGNLNTAVGLNALSANTDGDNNCAFGVNALVANTTGYNNNAFGFGALALNTTGGTNCAFGDHALTHHQTGSGNNAFGLEALFRHENGQSNNAFGATALASNVNGNNNTAAGDRALENCTGNSNTALGHLAGFNATSGSGNVYIGYAMLGFAGENNHTYIRNINSTTLSGDFVTVDLFTGLLGHATSSRRYKEQIRPLGAASEAIYRLQPVSFRYKRQIDPIQSLEYGLVAEDVAKVDPNLAIRNGQDEIESVRHTAVTTMLLSEFLKTHNTVQDRARKLRDQENIISQLEATLARHQAALEQEQKSFQSELAEQARRIQGLASDLQKLVDQIERNPPPLQVVAADH